MNIPLNPHNQLNQNINNNNTTNSPIINNKNSNNNVSEIQEFLNYLNSQNNMNLKKIILFYSKFSKLCEQFMNSLHPNYKYILNNISVDNSSIRKRLMNSKYKLQYVPCIFMLFENGKVNVHCGNELVSLVSFLNKNMEAFMVVKTNENLNRRKNSMIGQVSQNGNTPLNNMNITNEPNDINNMNDLNEQTLMIPNNRAGNRSNITPLNINRMSNVNEKKLKMKNLPRIKQSIPQDFNKEMDAGISSKRIVPKGRKEHKKMALSSINIIDGSKQLDTIEEETEEDTSDEEDEIDIQMEDAEILDDILDEDNQDTTIDPIIKKNDKKSLKEIAADMQQDRESIDEKNKPI
jgi:hypothetical protein